MIVPPALPSGGHAEQLEQTSKDIPCLLLETAEIARSASAVAVSSRLEGIASNQAAHASCTAISTSTASRQRWMRLRWSIGRRV